MRKSSSPKPKHGEVASQVAIPDKLYFRMGEVSRLTETEPFVLRFWETKFPQLKPNKTRSGHRLYRRQDVRTILEIKNLLYRQGFTIAGAKQKLSGDSQKPSAASAVPAPGGKELADLRAVKRELQGILTFLSRE